VVVFEVQQNSDVTFRLYAYIDFMEGRLPSLCRGPLEPASSVNEPRRPSSDGYCIRAAAMRRDSKKPEEGCDVVDNSGPIVACLRRRIHSTTKRLPS